MSVQSVDKANDDGSLFGRTSSDLIAFWGGTPCNQAIAITSVSTAAATTTTPYGYAASTQADAIVAGLNAVIAAMEECGFIAS